LRPAQRIPWAYNPRRESSARDIFLGGGVWAQEKGFSEIEGKGENGSIFFEPLRALLFIPLV
jgi:hypothetical protein